MSKLEIKRRNVQDIPADLASLGVLARVYVGRGVSSSNDVEYSLKHLIPPNQLSGVAEAAELIAEAITADASIMIVGDFDADGATSTAVAIKALKAMGANHVDFIVPNRFEFGYGLSPEIVGVAAMKQPDLIITVDNGVSSVDGVHAAQAMGMSVIVTDHHLPGDEIPTAEVIVNPNMAYDKFPSKNLAGVGVIFYVMLALRMHLRQSGWFQQANIPEPNMSQFLDLVALGTIADVVPLDKNNRTMVQQGLQRIRSGQSCIGIQALLQVSKREASQVSASDMGFLLGPRINAAGRMDDMRVGIECLLSDDMQLALSKAQQLDTFNQSRKEVEQTMRDEANQLLESIALKSSGKAVAYAVSGDNWHQGVVGLVASRLKEQMQRPVCVLAPADIGQTNGEWKGSLRSVQGVHIRDALVRLDVKYPDLLDKFGGHAMAAGLSIKADNISEFKKVFIEVIEEFTIGRDWSQVVLSDGELEEHEYTLECAELLRGHSPWGQEFPAPVFDGQFDVITARIVGDSHVKMRLRPRNCDNEIDAICFGYMRYSETLPHDLIHIVYRLDINYYQGNRSLQLIVEHVL